MKKCVFACVVMASSACALSEPDWVKPVPTAKEAYYVDLNSIKEIKKGFVQINLVQNNTGFGKEHNVREDSLRSEVLIDCQEKKSSNGSGLLILYDKPFAKGKVLSDATALSTPELDEFAEIAATDKNTLAIFSLLCKS